jgi:hypothetical protein
MATTGGLGLTMGLGVAQTETAQAAERRRCRRRPRIAAAQDMLMLMAMALALAGQGGEGRQGRDKGRWAMGNGTAEPAALETRVCVWKPGFVSGNPGLCLETRVLYPTRKHKYNSLSNPSHRHIRYGIVYTYTIYISTIIHIYIYPYTTTSSSILTYIHTLMVHGVGQTASAPPLPHLPAAHLASATTTGTASPTYPRI